MKKRIIISLMLVVAIITLSTAFIPTKETTKSAAQIQLAHPEAGYIENIGN
jgi:hypothetical protein